MVGTELKNRPFWPADSRARSMRLFSAAPCGQASVYIFCLFSSICANNYSYQVFSCPANVYSLIKFIGSLITLFDIVRICRKSTRQKLKLKFVLYLNAAPGCTLEILFKFIFQCLYYILSQIENANLESFCY